MTKNTIEVLVGTAVLALAAAFLFYMGQVAGMRSASGEYVLRASFRSVEGISVGTDVRLAGVKIGSVRQINLDPESFRAETLLSLPEAIKLPDDSSISISSEGLLGGNYVEIIPGGSPFELEPGQEIEDTQGAVSLISLLMKFVSGNGS